MPGSTPGTDAGTVNLSFGPRALGVIAFRGPDAAKFLQGQLSADVEKLAVGSGVLAGLHNPQGRAIALLALVRLQPGEILAALPAELVDTVLQRLRKYVLRAKVTLEDASPAYHVAGAWAGDAVSGIAGLPWGTRRLLFLPADRVPTADAAASATWELADVREGRPQVYAATSEAFVAQMLNLDLLGAIAFDKGCYTGQEVIARAHYRGRVKRRLQRWANESPAPLAPGDAARAADGRSLQVVRVAAREGGGQEVLAVGNYAPASADDASATMGEDAATVDGVVLTGPLPLPYSLPDLESG